LVALVRGLKERGAALYRWSSGGAAYARAAAEEVGLGDCFEAFLPKPHLLLGEPPTDEPSSLAHDGLRLSPEDGVSGGCPVGGPPFPVGALWIAPRVRA
jgi:hypothetical protein